ncbi:serine/threonine protein phosphatase [Niabella ginsenosidivorans]|uniref:Serine/threonine protein phosphatase n=1 Tax=Niabella ginsenosidivorans TaxID=1176587 RepID=A0A1A9I099_9BACT|nr:protein phosphatase 2C domain-containing protein [Niabella ginsenosidivorans]ANH81068.1 serine/threonine protein phosphatase [Niabella ginsenosidivorans]
MNRTIELYGQTDLGRRREENEDTFIAVPNLWNTPSRALVGAIDGVGGYEGGAEAASMVKETIEEYLQHFSFGAPLQLLKEASIAANNKVYEERGRQEALNRMSCVLSVAVLDADKEMMYIAHVGDSRGYVYRNGHMLKITRDHSDVGMKEDSGYLTEQEAMQHPRRNEISKMAGELFLDAEDSGKYFDIGEHSFLPGDIALFCSDGLTDLVTRAQMAAILSTGESLPKKAQQLIDKANELGGKDNITVVLATYKAAKKAGRKKAVKSTIEVPIAQENIPTEKPAHMQPNTPATVKKKTGLVPVIIAFVIGYLVNWNGTGSFFSKEAAPLPVTDTTAIRMDTLPVSDSSHLQQPDTLINATDTIYKDSAHRNALQGY